MRLTKNQTKLLTYWLRRGPDIQLRTAEQVQSLGWLTNDALPAHRALTRGEVLLRQLQKKGVVRLDNDAWRLTRWARETNWVYNTLTSGDAVMETPARV